MTNNETIIKEFEKNFPELMEDELKPFRIFLIMALKQKDKEWEERDEKILEDYSSWLNKHHYIDSDYYTEEPQAIPEYLKSKQYKLLNPDHSGIPM